MRAYRQYHQLDICCLHMHYALGAMTVVVAALIRVSPFSVHVFLKQRKKVQVCISSENNFSICLNVMSCKLQGRLVVAGLNYQFALIFSCFMLVMSAPRDHVKCQDRYV